MKYVFQIIVILFIAFVPAPACADDATTYLVTVGQPITGGEKTGYVCKIDEICRIKISICPECEVHPVISTRIQFFDDDAFILFEREGQFLWVSRTHVANRQFLKMHMNKHACVADQVYLFNNRATTDNGLTRNDFAEKLKLSICPSSP